MSRNYLSSHYVVIPVLIHNPTNHSIVLKNRQIEKMSVDDMLSFFGTGTRKGSKIDTMKDCLRQLFNASFPGDNNYVGKKFFIRIQKSSNPLGTIYESVSTDTILALASKMKILATYNSTKTKSLCLITEVCDKFQDDFTNCLYSEIENGSIVIFGHHQDKVDAAIERSKNEFVNQ